MTAGAGVREPMLRFSSKLLSFVAFFICICFTSGIACAQENTSALCGDRDPGRTRILIGSFLVSGDAGKGTTRNLDKVFSGTIAGLFGSSDTTSNISVFVWERSNARPFQSAGPLIELAFLQGGLRGDQRSERLIENLAKFLSDQNCDYLVGGQLTRDAKLLIATPFLFSVAEKTFSDSLRPVVQEATIPANRAAEFFATQFNEYIQKRRMRSDTVTEQLTIGCFRLLGESEKTQRNLVPTLELAQKTAITELSSDARWAGRLSKSPVTICSGSDPAPAPPNTVAFVEGIVVSTRNERPLLRSILRVMLSPAKSFEVSVDPNSTIGFATDPTQSTIDYGFVRTFVGQVKRLLLAVTSSDGTILPGKSVELPASTEEVWQVLNARLEADRAEEALLLGYKALDRAPDEPFALLGIARALREKSEASAAGQYLSRAAKAKDKVTQANRGLFLESLGSTYASLGLNAEAIEYLSSAKDAFRRQNRNSDAARVVRSIAVGLLKTNKIAEAKETLLSQENVERDPETLFALARVSVATGNIDETVEWLSKANALDPSNDQFQRALAWAYGALGKKAATEGDSSQAKLFFKRALSFREDGEILYLTGVLAHEENDFRSAITAYERLLALPTDKVSPTWVGSSWLNVLECYLLIEDWDAVWRRGQIALGTALANVDEFRFIALYLQLLATALTERQQPADVLVASELYRNFKDLRGVISLDKLDWNNSKIKIFLESQQGVNEGRMEILRQVTTDLMSGETKPSVSR
jgi:tetratricopeptide (TPR) repeat protein